MDLIPTIFRTMAEIQPKYLDLKRLSIYASISVGSLRDYIRDGDLPAYRLKGKVLVKRSTFDNWIDEHPFQTDIDDITDSVMGELLGESNR